MAVSKAKNKSDAVKKTAAAAADKSSGKAGKKAPKKNEILVKVPQGGQTIRSFNLTPAKPSNGKAGDWLLVDAASAKPKDISLIRVSFSTQSTSVEQDFERAVLIVNLQQNPNENGRWRFVMNGVAADPQYSDTDHDVAVVIADQGQTLITQVQVIGDTQEDIQFGFVASFTDAVSGEVTIYESKDPGVIPGRP